MCSVRTSVGISRQLPKIACTRKYLSMREQANIILCIQCKQIPVNVTRTIGIISDNMMMMMVMAMIYITSERERASAKKKSKRKRNGFLSRTMHRDMSEKESHI